MVPTLVHKSVFTLLPLCYYPVTLPEPSHDPVFPAERSVMINTVPPMILLGESMDVYPSACGARRTMILRQGWILLSR